MKKIKISVVTCTLNPKAEHLKKALKSIESQSFKNIEHIVNDSHSNQSTIRIIQDYIKRNRKKYLIKFIHTKPRGIARALNDASKIATGEIIHTLHSDEYYLDKDSLKRAESYFTSDTNWIIGDHVLEFKKNIYRLPTTKLFRINPERVSSSFVPLSHANTFMKTSLLKKYGGFNETVKIAVEYPLWFNMLKKEKPKFVDDAFTVFLIHRGSQSSGGVKPLIDSVKEIIRIQRGEKITPFIGWSKKSP